MSQNEHISQGEWKEFKGKIKEKWGDLSDDDLEKTKGNMEQIAGKIQKKYGESTEAARKKLNEMRDQGQKKKVS